MFAGRKDSLDCISCGFDRGEKMPSVERVISYISIGIVLFVGILVMSGVMGFLEPTYRMLFGLLIIAYAGIRLTMLYSTGRRDAKKP